VELGYARVSTAKQDLDRQIEAPVDAGVARERIYVDKKSGATVDRPGMRAVLEYARGARDRRAPSIASGGLCATR
jgi:DNA invertase Pin-like site-specific DNA recombinase